MKKKFWTIIVIIIIIISFSYIVFEIIIDNKNEYPRLNTKIYDVSDNSAYLPSIHKNYIVWSQKYNDTYNINLYSLDSKTNQQLTNNNSIQYNSDIFNNYIVWENVENNNNDIFLYEINTKIEKRISKTNCTNTNPKIFGNNIIWVEIDYDYNFPKSINWIRIAVYNIETENIFYIANNYTNHYQYDLFPDLYGNHIVWTDMRYGDGYNTKNSNYDIFLYDIINRTEEQISTKISYEGSPRIFDEYIYWIEDDSKKGYSKSYFYQYNIKEKKTKKLFENDYYQFDYEVSNQFVVWSNNDIIIYNISSKKMYEISQVPDDNLLHSQINPDIYNDNIVWEYRILRGPISFPDSLIDTKIQYTKIR